jgi:hypothetical protein
LKLYRTGTVDVEGNYYDETINFEVPDNYEQEIEGKAAEFKLFIYYSQEILDFPFNYGDTIPKNYNNYIFDLAEDSKTISSIKDKKIIIPFKKIRLTSSGGYANYADILYTPMGVLDKTEENPLTIDPIACQVYEDINLTKIITYEAIFERS